MKKGLIVLSCVLGIVSLTGCNDLSFEVNIIYTNDTHGEINRSLSFATVGKMKQELKNDGKNVLLLDAGDHISGGFYTTYDKGKSIVEFMNMAGYDAATLGNHEFDYDFTYLKDLMKVANYPYIATNFYHMKDNVPTTRFTDLSSKVFSFRNVKIGVFGIATPDSITTSTPSHFQDKDGKFIYTFLENNLYECAQKEIDELRKQCNYVICLSHLGDEDQEVAYTASKLASNTSGIDVILDGHTHKTVLRKNVKDKSNKDVLITQAGGKFSRIGKLKITNKGIDNELISESSKFDEDLRIKERNYIETVDKSLSKKIATSAIDFVATGKKEDNIGDLLSEPSFYYYNVVLPSKGENTKCNVTFVNSGGIRDSVSPGDWTLRTCKDLHPFGNGVCLVKMKGSLLRTILEFSSYKIPGYFGGLQQTCGVKYEVDTSIESDIVIDKNRAYVSGPSIEKRRCKNIKIFNPDTKDFVDMKDDETYFVGGSSYVLLDGGDGMSMVKNATFVRKEMSFTDYDLLVNYLSNFKKENDVPTISNANSPLVEKYPNLTINYTDSKCSGRIVAI